MSRSLLCPLCLKESCCNHTSAEQEVYLNFMTLRQKVQLRRQTQALVEQRLCERFSLPTPQQERELRAQEVAANRHRKQKVGFIPPSGGWIGPRVSVRARQIAVQTGCC